MVLRRRRPGSRERAAGLWSLGAPLWVVAASTRFREDLLGSLFSVVAMFAAVWIGLAALGRVRKRQRRRTLEVLAAALPELGRSLAATADASSRDFLPPDQARHPAGGLFLTLAGGTRSAIAEAFEREYASHVSALRRADEAYVRARSLPLDGEVSLSHAVATLAEIRDALADTGSAAEFARSLERRWREAASGR